MSFFCVLFLGLCLLVKALAAQGKNFINEASFKITMVQMDKNNAFIYPWDL